MSLLKNMLLKMVIGPVSVETRLFNELFIPGEFVRGEMTVKGSSSEQQIDSIYLSIASTYEDKVDIKNVKCKEREINETQNSTIVDLQISEPFIINPDQTIKFDIDLTLPSYTPVTVGTARTWVQIHSGIQPAIETIDKNYIHVQPHPLVDAVLGSAMDIGLEVCKVVCESVSGDTNIKVPFIQKFILQPVEGHLKSRLEEIEFIFKPSNNSLDVFMEVDRNLKGVPVRLSEKLSAVDSMIKFEVSYENLDDLTLIMNELIEEQC